MSENNKVVYDCFMIEDGGYDYEPIALLKNGEIKRIGDSTHNPSYGDEIEAILETAKEYAGDRIIINHHGVTKENVSNIQNERVRSEFEQFVEYL